MLALVREVSPALARCELTHLVRSPIDAARAARQHGDYTQALQTLGCTLEWLPPLAEYPDSVFVEDTVVLFRNVAVVTRPGAPTRQPETVDVEKVVAELGCSVNAIRAPGTLDGGDVLKVGDTVYVGCGGRTNAEGVRQLRAALEPLGAHVVAVPTTKVLHLKSAVTALPDGTVVGYPETVDDPALYPAFLAVPEEPGSHVVLLGGGRLLMSAAAPRTAELFGRLGYEPVPVDIGEFEKLEGCVTCLSVRVRDLYA